MAQTTGKSKMTVMVNGEEIETEVHFKVDFGEEEASVAVPGLAIQPFEVTFEATSEWSEPLGVRDQLIWGPLLN